MNKNNEPDKHAVDALFARKLGNASTPTPGGFGRLQARLNRTSPVKEAGFMVWRNPNVQKFMAIAACLLVLCLFGWLYLSNTTGAEEPQLATATTGNVPAIDVPATPQANGTSVPTTEQTNEVNSTIGNQPAERVTSVAPKTSGQDRAGSTLGRQSTNVKAITPAPRIELAQTKSTEQRQTERLTEQPAPKKVIEQTPVPAAPDQIATVKPVPTAQRVLIVTIAEPERLVAARQAVKMDMMETALAAASKPEKAAKPGFWEQVRRVKEGEAFARPDGSDDEGGLLNRAFNGLKNSIDKDKTARQ